MTDDQTQSLHDDIAYMRAMAQEGRNAPLLSGPIMVAAGIIFGTASLAQWSIQTGIVDVSPWAQLWVWVASGAAFGVALSVLIRRLNTKPGARSAGNKAVGAAWTGVGFGIFAMWAAFMAVGLTSGSWEMMRAMPIVVFAAYGSAWFVGGTMAGVKWMNWVAMLSYAGAVLLGVFSTSPHLLLIYAVMLVLVALLPRLALMRQEPAEVV